MNSVLTLGAIPWAPPLIDDADPAAMAGLASNVSKVRMVYDDAVAKAQSIASSRDLTPAGRRNRLSDCAISSDWTHPVSRAEDHLISSN
jgi:hypothetical protein